MSTLAKVTIALLVLGLPSLAPAATDETRLDVRISAAIDLYQYVRRQAKKAEPTAHEDYAAAIEAARKIDAQLEGIFLGWGFLDRTLVGSELAEDILERFRELPREFTLQSGTKLSLRQEAIALAEELVKAERRFLVKEWPGHRAALEQALRGVEARLLPKQKEALGFMLQSLGMQDPRNTIPVYLVTDAPWPGAFTFSREAGGGVCFVAVRELQETLLYEIILHEATHALDVVSEAGSVLEDLRQRLERVGLDRRDKLWRDVPHTIMFIQAGETIRRLVDPEHVHYGDGGYYDKVRRVADVELPLWKQHLDGELGRNETLSRIVEAITSGEPSSP